VGELSLAKLMRAEVGRRCSCRWQWYRTVALVPALWLVVRSAPMGEGAMARYSPPDGHRAHYGYVCDDALVRAQWRYVHLAQRRLWCARM